MKKSIFSRISKTIITKIFIFLGLLIFSNSALADEIQEIVIMGTTDLHGSVYPYDYFNGKEKNSGLAKLSTLIGELRQHHPYTLLLDSGDCLQGTPLTHYFAKEQTMAINPMAKVMNYLNYDAMAVGNHEYDYGLSYLMKTATETRFPFLSANTYYVNDPRMPFEPYLIKQVGKVRVGIIGFTPPSVALWSRGIVEGQYRFENMIGSARQWLPFLRKQVDLLIAIPHSGWGNVSSDNGSDEEGKSLDNLGLLLARQFPEIDVMLLGHTHTEISEKKENGVIISQAGHHGNRLAVVKVEIEKTRQGWQIKTKQAKTYDIKDVPPDQKLLTYLQKEHQDTLAYIRTPLGKTTVKWSGQRARWQDTPLVDFINKVQQDVAGTQLSAAALFSETAEIPVGDISFADIAGLYIYENTLIAVKITGRQLKEYLENSARFYRIDPHGKLSADPEVPGYNYDMISGVDYRIDVSKPIGQRIVFLQYQGKNVEPDMSFTMAMNNYRKSGSGGYVMLKDVPLIYDQQENIRELLIEYIRHKGVLKPEEIFQQNWEVVVPGQN